MPSVTTFLTAHLSKVLRDSKTPRIAALVVVAMLGAIIGPPGIAVGPIQSRTNTPALPTGAAMQAQTVISSIPISFDLVQVFLTLAQDNTSYPVRTIGPLSFPDGAIDVPWMEIAQPPSRGGRDSRVAEVRGTTISLPRGNGLPRMFRTAETHATPNRAVTSGDGLVNDTRSIVLFDRAGSDLGGEATDLLDRIADGLNGSSARIQLLAFGGTIAERSHTARRLALRRALAVRNYLMGRGISQERITVRAMGGATDGGPADRVDIVFPAQ